MTEKEQLQQWRDSGMSLKEMAVNLGISERTVSRRLQSYGLTNASDRTDISDDEILRMWNEGMSVNQIADAFHSTNKTISKRLSKLGVTCDRVDGIRRHFAKTHSDLWEQIKFDLDDFVTVSVICSKYHMRMEHAYRLMFQNAYLGMTGNWEQMTVTEMSAEYRNRRFQKKAAEVHDGKYDYSQVQYQSNHEKVTIICPEHGAFLQTPANHLAGHGCPNCVKRKCSIRRKPVASVPVVDNTCSLKEQLYQMLCERFGEDSVCKNYKAFGAMFDFYVTSFDLLIDVGEHNGMNLPNYFVFFGKDLQDAKLWFAMGCPKSCPNPSSPIYHWLPKRVI